MFGKTQRAHWALLQVFMGCPIFIVHREISDYELNSPFTYIRLIVESNGSSEMMS